MSQGEEPGEDSGGGASCFVFLMFWSLILEAEGSQERLEFGGSVSIATRYWSVSMTLNMLAPVGPGCRLSPARREALLGDQMLL